MTFCDSKRSIRRYSHAMLLEILDLRTDLIQEELLLGKTMKMIGRVLKITPQRVDQIAIHNKLEWSNSYSARKKKRLEKIQRFQKREQLRQQRVNALHSVKNMRQFVREGKFLSPSMARRWLDTRKIVPIWYKHVEVKNIANVSQPAEMETAS